MGLVTSLCGDWVVGPEIDWLFLGEDRAVARRGFTDFVRAGDPRAVAREGDLLCRETK